MKKNIILLLFFSFIQLELKAQETYGSTLNLGLGAGYYKYTDHTTPVLQANYELKVAKNFTLAPFLSYYSYSNDYYWDSKKYPSKYYHYHETVIPIGVKGAYYFDDLLKADSKWDFYLAASLGFAFVKTSWDSDYYGDRYIYRDAHRGSTPLYLDLHIGTEYHFNKKVGMFLDLSTGVSTIGIAIH